MLRVSVVVVTWNGRALLERFLPSVLATDYPGLEVVVADNASSDGSAEWLARAHPPVRVVRHAENKLFAGGNNAAVPAASGELLVFLNNDVEVPPGWLRPLAAAFADPGVWAAQPKLLQHGDRGRFEYAGAAGGFLDRLGVPFTRGRVFSSLEPDRGQYDDARDIFWATGAAFAVRRDVFERLGGFWEPFGMHMEEIDLCWRVWRVGGRVRAVPESTVWHLGGASLPQGDPRKTHLNVRNSLAMLARNLPPRLLARALAERRVLDAAGAARALAAGRRAEAEAIRRAWRDFAAWRPQIAGPPAGETAVVPAYRGRVAVDYYARGRRRFSDLSVPAEPVRVLAPRP